MITYPLNLPARPYFKAVRFNLAEAVAYTESPFTFSRQYQRHPGQLWTVSAELPPMNRADGQRWVAFKLALRGGSGTFLLTYPETTALGAASGTPRLNGAAAAGAEEIYTTGWTPATSNVLLAGDVIQLGSGAATSLHQVLRDADSGAEGNAWLDIAPRLRAPWSNNTAIVTTGAQGLFRLAGPVVGWDIDDMRMYGLTLDAVEALPGA